MFQRFGKDVCDHAEAWCVLDSEAFGLDQVLNEVVSQINVFSMPGP